MKTVARLAVVAVPVVVAAGCASATPAVAPAAAFRAPATVVEAPVAARTTAADAAVSSLVVAPAKKASPTFLDPWRAAGSDGDAPEVQVVATRDVTAPREDSTLHEDQYVGPNKQPEWTTQRRWATARAYVLAPGQMEVEQWVKMHAPRGEGPDYFFQTELGFGLPYRFQVDLYENYGDEGPHTPTKHLGNQVEVRWAFAEWGKIPLNPTIYEEVKFNHRAPEVFETKLLLADDIGPGGHAALNIFHEQEVSGARACEMGVAGGISWAVCDSVFSMGLEAKYERVTERGSRDDPANELLVGPSFQWRPTENMHVDLTTLAGLTKGDRRDPRYELYLVIGWDFGPEVKGGHAPTSSRSK